MIRKMLLVLSAVVATATTARAGVGECEFLLRQGIRDELTVYENVHHERVDTSALCSAKSEAEQQGLSVYWAGIRLGYDQAKAMAETMCSSSFSAANFVQSNSLATNVVSQSLMNSVNECLKVATGGLDVQSDYALNDTHVRISMSFRPRGAGDKTTDVTVKDIHLTGNIVCSGSLYKEWSEKHTAKIDVDNSDIFCDLRDNKDQVDLSDTLTEVPGGLVELTTTAGNITRSLPSHHPHSRKLEAEFDTFKASIVNFASDNVRIQTGLAKPTAERRQYIGQADVTFPEPFPEGFKAPEIVLSIEGMNATNLSINNWHIENLTNKGFSLVFVDMHAFDWGAMRIRYHAIAVRKGL